MPLNLNNKTYTYTVKPDGSVDYKANADAKPQNLSGRDTSSKEALEADLDAYTEAYLAGLQTTQVTVGDGITVGKAETAEA